LTIQNLEIASIEIDPERNLREEITTADLEESMGAIGLLHPIQVLRKPGSGFILNAGERRLRAAMAMGWDTIEARILEGQSELDAELAAIDENIVRRDLHGASLDRALARRKELYLQKFPDTAAHVAGGKARASGPDVERPRSFVEDTADKTGKSTRTIERSVRRAERLSPATMKAYEEGRITQSQADVLAGRPWEEQDQVLGQVVGRSVDDTRRIIAGEFEEAKPEADPGPMKHLEDLYMYGQKVVSVLEHLGRAESLDPEFVESVLNLRDSLNEEFDRFAEQARGLDDNIAFPEEPPF
jgi:ParB/RepB/Spo0J family partition protein